MTYVKCRAQEVDMITATGSAQNQISAVRLLIPWFRGFAATGPTPGAGPLVADGVATFARSAYSCERFVKMRENYKEYAITGVRVEYVPAVNPGTGGIYPTNAIYSSSLQTMTPAAAIEPFDLAKQLGKTGVRTFRPNRKFKQWLSFKRVAKAEHTDWQLTSGVNS